MVGSFGSVLYATNIDFSGSLPPSGNININGELLVGASVAPFIRPYVPTGSNGLVVNTGPGTIDFSLANIPNSSLQNSTITLTPGNGLSGGGGVSLGNSVSIALKTPVTLANGGTNANLTASNGGIFWSNASQAQILAGTATANQVLLSGASATPSWSTATYPASSGGSGKILFDNGTNFIESTPTFPASASATSRKIIVSDGTNWVASTETWATPGSSGNVLTSDGTNWTSAAAAGGILLQTTSQTWSNAALKAGTALTLVAAGAAGTVIVPVSVVLKFVYGGTNAFTNSPNVQINYGSTTNSNVIGVVVAGANTVFWEATANAYANNAAALTTGITGGQFLATACEATLVSATVSTALTGNAAGNNTVKVILTYYVVSM